MVKAASCLLRDSTDVNQKFLACGQALNLILEFKNKLRFPCNIDCFFFFFFSRVKDFKTWNAICSGYMSPSNCTNYII